MILCLVELNRNRNVYTICQYANIKLYDVRRVLYDIYDMVIDMHIIRSDKILIIKYSCVCKRKNYAYQTIFLKKELIPTVRKNCMMYITIFMMAHLALFYFDPTLTLPLAFSYFWLMFLLLYSSSSHHVFCLI